MRGVVPVIEHMILTASMFAIFIFAYTSFYKINNAFLERARGNALDLVSEKVARAVIMAYEIGKNSDSQDDPVSKINVELPPDIGGYPYRVYYETGKIMSASKTLRGEAEIFSINTRVQIQGDITSTGSKSPQEIGRAHV